MSLTDEATSAATSSPLTEGSWRVDPSRSELGFFSRGMFGLAPVNGSFHDFEGELTVTGGDARGELRIKAASLDTANGRRDKHLRSPDFFDAENHETLTFRLLGVTPAAAGTTLQGVLQIKGTELELSAPLQVDAKTGELILSTELEVDRKAAGLGWSKAGMIKGPAKLNAKVTLVNV